MSLYEEEPRTCKIVDQAKQYVFLCLPALFALSHRSYVFWLLLIHLEGVPSFSAAIKLPIAKVLSSGLITSSRSAVAATTN